MASAKEVGAQALSDAETLPKSSGGLIIGPGFGYGPGALQRFGNGWSFGRESLVADFDQIELTEVIGIQAPTSFGVTSFKAKQTAFAINFLAAYGVTDRLTVAALLPFMFVKYRLDAALEPDAMSGKPHSDLRVVNAEQFTCPGGEITLEEIFDPENQFLVPGGDNYKFNIGDLGRALSSDCFGYRNPFDETRSVDNVIHGYGDRTFSGFRDLALAAKYQVYRSRAIHLGLIGYMIAPTGKPDDPNDLFDFKFGDGNWGAALLAAMTIPLGDFQIGASVGYEIEFADTIEVRLNNLSFSDELEGQLATGAITEEQLFDDYLDEATVVPIATRYDQVKVKRKLGDNIYVYTSFNYQILEWLGVGVTINFLHHFRDRVDEIGPRPEGAPRFRTEAEVRADVAAQQFDSEEDRLDALRAGLTQTEGRRKAAYAWHTVRGNVDLGFGVNVNTVGLFLRGEFPLPLIVGLGINRFIAGQNLDTPEAINLSLAIPFVTSLDVIDPAEYGFDDEVGGGLPYP
jgi:hypothetical protein